MSFQPAEHFARIPAASFELARSRYEMSSAAGTDEEPFCGGAQPSAWVYVRWGRTSSSQRGDHCAEAFAGLDTRSLPRGYDTSRGPQLKQSVAQNCVFGSSNSCCAHTADAGTIASVCGVPPGGFFMSVRPAQSEWKRAPCQSASVLPRSQCARANVGRAASARPVHRQPEGRRGCERRPRVRRRRGEKVWF